jgi:hypothetical protein
MKTRTLTSILVTLAISHFGILSGAAQTQKAEPATGEKATQIVFVPNTLLKEQMASGKLKEDVFYWSHLSDNTEIGPKVVTEEGKTFLRMVGFTKESPNNDNEKLTISKNSILTVVRAYNVPEGATGVKYTFTGRNNEDPWENPLATTTPDLAYPAGGLHLTKEGKSMPGVLRVLAANQENKIWGTYTGQGPIIPAGTQQVVFILYCRAYKPFDLAGMNVEFTFPAPKK